MPRIDYDAAMTGWANRAGAIIASGRLAEIPSAAGVSTMSDLPNAATVGPHRYRIEAVDGILRDAGARGETFSDRLHIRVDSQNLAPTVEREVLVHELLHAIIASTPVRGVCTLNDEDEERFISALAPALLELLRENPDIVTYLTAS